MHTNQTLTSAARDFRRRVKGELAAQGLSTKDIARELVVSPRTVDAHLAKVFRKLDVRSRSEIGGQLGGHE